MAHHMKQVSLRNSDWTNKKVVVPVLLITALIGGYFVFATSAVSDAKPMLVDRNGRDNHAGVKAFACNAGSAGNNKLRLAVTVKRPSQPKYNVEALKSRASFGKTESSFVSGWTDNQQSYFVNVDADDNISVNVIFSNRYSETYQYIQHEDGRIAPVYASQLDNC